MLLVVDTRERAVIECGFGDEFEVKIEQITVGDYAVVDNNRIIAIFERKTIADFVASIKDGRMDNRNKMLQLRKETGCAIFFIVEGRNIDPSIPLSGNITYANIESSIFHMMMRDGIHAVWTKNAFETSQILVRFMKSMTTLPPSKDLLVAPTTMETLTLTHDSKIAVIDERGIIIRQEGEGGASAGDVLGCNEPFHTSASNLLLAPTPSSPPLEAIEDVNTKSLIDKLKEERKKPEDALLVDMWKCFINVGTVSATVLATNFSLHDVFITRSIGVEALERIRINGRKLPAKTIESIVNPSPLIQRKILSLVPRWSARTTNVILERYLSLKAIIEDDEVIHEQITEKNKLGISRLSNLKLFMNKKIILHGA